MPTQMSPETANGWTRVMEAMSDASYGMSPLMAFAPHSPARLAKAALQHQCDALAFLQQRCGAHLALVERLEAAGSPMDFYSAWLEFAGEAMSAYAQAGQKLALRGSQEALEASGAGTGEELQAVMASAKVVA